MLPYQTHQVPQTQLLQVNHLTVTSTVREDDMQLQGKEEMRREYTDLVRIVSKVVYTVLREL